jgi:hypothetical protein
MIEPQSGLQSVFQRHISISHPRSVYSDPATEEYLRPELLANWGEHEWCIPCLFLAVPEALSRRMLLRIEGLGSEAVSIGF